MSTLLNATLLVTARHDMVSWHAAGLGGGCLS